MATLSFPFHSNIGEEKMFFCDLDEDLNLVSCLICGVSPVAGAMGANMGSGVFGE